MLHACAAFEPNRATRVAMIVANPCANDSRVIKQAESLAMRGYDVRVYCLAASGLAASESRNGVRYVRCREPHRRIASGAPTADIGTMPAAIGGSGKLRWIPAAAKRRLGPFIEHWLHAATFTGKVADFHPDIIHAHDFNVLPAAVRAARRTTAAVVYDMHELEEGRHPLPGPMLKWWKRVIERRALAHVAGAITVSPSIARYHAARYGRPAPTLVLNAPRMVPGLDCTDDVRSRCGLGAQAPLAVYVGSVSMGRGVETLLAALATMPDMHLAIVGSIRPELQAIVAAYRSQASLAGRLHLIGPVPHGEVVPFIRTADLGVCTIPGPCLNYELCLPNKLFEMTFAGLPVLVSRTTELSAFVAASGTGLAVDAGDPRAIARGLTDVYRQREQLRPTGEHLARLYAEYGWERQERRLLALYASILGARPVAAPARSPVLRPATPVGATAEA